MKIKCPKCEGDGVLSNSIFNYSLSNQETGPDWDETCSLCHGEGKVDPAELFEVRCEECNGHGRLPITPNGYLPHDHDRDCDICKGTGWRPMTADEMEEMLTWKGLLDSIRSEQMTFHGKPVRLKEKY